MNGSRITTDILVAGYIRDIAKEYKLLIPNAINGVCFAYFYQWNKKFPMDHVETNGQEVQLRINIWMSYYE